MQKHRFIKSHKSAIEIWSLREYFNHPKLSLSDLSRIFLELYPDSGLKSRKVHYKAFYERFKDVAAEEVTTTEIKNWLSAQMDRYNLSERTLAHLKVQISPLFKWLTSEHIIDANPLLTIKFSRKIQPRRKKCVLTLDELHAIKEGAKKVDTQFLYPYLYTLIHTGARRSEAANLRWEDVDLENQTMMFRHTKNGSDRKIKMSGYLCRALGELEHRGEYVFQNSKGKPVHRSDIERRLNQFKEKNPIEKNWHLHDLRHSFAYNFLKKGGEMYQLQAILGNKSIQMTIDLYGNLKSHDIENPSPYEF